MNDQQTHTLQLAITVKQNRTVLSRCLQTFSRRGFTLTALTTKNLEDGDAILHCTLHGPQSWHTTLPQLLHKLIDVKKVEIVEAS